jgi:hypothetical protein
MIEPKPHRIIRPFTPEEREMFVRAKREDEEDMPLMIAEAKADMRRLERLAEARFALKAAREAAGLTVESVAAKADLGEQELGRLENERLLDVPLATLMRVADAVGVEIRLTVGAPASEAA